MATEVLEASKLQQWINVHWEDKGHG